MSWNSKVVWSEGMFLRPQHFQQQERYLETLLQERTRPLLPYFWGITELTLDRDALALGKLAVVRCRGLLPDGTPIRIPEDDPPPPPLEVGDELRDSVILLGLPIRRQNSIETDREHHSDPAARFHSSETQVRDNIAGFDTQVDIEVGDRRWTLLPDRSENRRDYATIGIARIVEKRADRQVILDEHYLPPTLDCQAVPVLAGFLNEISGLLHQRGEALAGRVSASGKGGVAEIADFLMLQLINRYQPLFRHYSQCTLLHPERFYSCALGLAGELATFTAAGKRPTEFPAYNHDDLQTPFASLMQDLRQSLSMVIEQNAIQLPLQERGYGIRVSPITDRSLIDSATFVLAVNADMAAATLSGRFPAQAKIGPVEHIRQMVMSHLPGIGLRALAVAPRQMPYHAGFSYFELDKSNDYWKQMTSSGGFAIHVPDKFPGLEMAFWAIKG